jgi:hypothetical protein
MSLPGKRGCCRFKLKRISQRHLIDKTVELA